MEQQTQTTPQIVNKPKSRVGLTLGIIGGVVALLALSLATLFVLTNQESDDNTFNIQPLTTAVKAVPGTRDATVAMKLDGLSPYIAINLTFAQTTDVTAAYMRSLMQAIADTTPEHSQSIKFIEIKASTPEAYVPQEVLSASLAFVPNVNVRSTWAVLHLEDVRASLRQ